MTFHPDVLAAHAEFGGDLEAMQALYDRPDHIKRIADLERQIAELRDHCNAMEVEHRQAIEEMQSALADKARLSEALTEVRSLMIVERTDDGRIAGIGHASDALPKIVTILDAALSGSSAGGWQSNGKVRQATESALAFWRSCKRPDLDDEAKVRGALVKYQMSLDASSLPAAPTATGGR